MKFEVHKVEIAVNFCRNKYEEFSYPEKFPYFTDNHHHMTNFYFAQSIKF